MYFFDPGYSKNKIDFFCLYFLNCVYFLLEYFNIYFKSTTAPPEIKRANTMRNKCNLGKGKC